VAHEFLDWTLKAIREDGPESSWMEELKFDWTPLAGRAFRKILDGQAVLIFTDEKRQWFSQYIRSSVNMSEKGRPFLPLYDIYDFFPQLHTIQSANEMALIEDTLDVSFPQGYFLWYIGEGDHQYAKFAHRSDENFLWMIDEDFPDSLSLRGSDPLLDVKLIQLYGLFDKTIEAVLYDEVSLDT